MRKKSKFKHSVYLLIALAMLLYALPKLSVQNGSGWVLGFGIVWCIFAFLVIASHLHFIIGVDEEKQKRLDAVRKAKLAQWQGKWNEEGRVSQRS
ncbi:MULTISPECIES: hypothetical protein [unclassified Paenibacillus]|uniref:hypothetical protein n=1 Tax=unclassified Paenibacillus TaxID=185978 RepID=UPI0003E1F43E|nr:MULTISPECIES: hypothetical protein [unclassified Paenibacillus]ETT55431.1 hypothetical protein C162_03207 [Paenibacillus sp. FSL R7-269]OMF98862.1 hypothetical protein BK147_08530 [Paenibacillus sp. FSL R7-0337]